MKLGLIIALSVIGGLLLLILLLKIIFKSTQNSLNEIIKNKFSERDIILFTTNANYFGVRSKGGKQIRGNGALILTRESLYFILAVPRKEIVIPIKSISDISTPKTFNGKSVFSPLLCIHYTLDNKRDEIAWVVNNLEKWIKEIKSLQSVNL